jgi:phenylalanine-4-hydroxylase
MLTKNLGIQVRHLESRSKAKRDDSHTGCSVEKEEDGDKTDYYITFESSSEASTAKLIKELEEVCISLKLLPIHGAPSANSVWFPRHISQLHRCCTALFKYGSELGTDHPGYGDKEYVQRRRVIAEVSKGYK